MMRVRSRQWMALLFLLATVCQSFAVEWPGLPQLRMPKMPQWHYQESKSFALEGWIDHTTTFVSDSSAIGSFQEDLQLHTSRLIIGAKGEVRLAGRLNYLVRTGVTFAQNSLYEQRVLTPEFQADLNWSPLKQVQLGAFARYGWRRPNAFMVDSLRRKDMVAGLRLGLQPLEHTEIALLFGNRMEINNDEESDHKFLRGELEQRLPFWNDFLIRLEGESEWYGLADSLTFDHERTLGSISMMGELPGGVHVHSRSAYVYRDGVKRILGQNRVRAQLWEDHRLSANAGADFIEQDERRIYRRQMDVSWRYMPWHFFGAEVKAENERVLFEDIEDDAIVSEDWDHRRAVEVGVLWDLKPLQHWAHKIEAANTHQGWNWKSLFNKGVWMKRHLAVRGHLSGGYAETRNYGKGVLGSGALEIIQPVEVMPWFNFSMVERIEAELFHMNDLDIVAPGDEENQVEVDNLLQFKSTLFPRGTLQLGHSIAWRRHVGTHFMFSEDTLHNTVNNEVWLKWRRPVFQASVSGMVLQHLEDHAPVDLERRIATRLRYQPMRFLAFNVRGVFRPRVHELDARLWVRAFAEVEVNKLTLTADMRFSGDPDDFGSRDTQAWIHVLRRLW